MPAVILDGTQIATEIKQDLAKKIRASTISPGLAAVLVGDNAASALYVKLKEKAAIEVGITFHKYLSTPDCYPDISEQELFELIKFLNNDPTIDAILVQLPLPAKYDTDKVLKLVDKNKDVDAFTNTKLTSPTVEAIAELLKATKEDLHDKKTLILGNSEVFTQAIAKYVKKEFGIKEVTIEHAIPKDSQEYDVIIIALGQAHALKKSHVKDGAIVIDVGINKLDGATVGDVDPVVAEVAGYLSPVPGGVGPLTVACLMRNTYLLAQEK